MDGHFPFDETSLVTRYRLLAITDLRPDPLSGILAYLAYRLPGIKPAGNSIARVRVKSTA